jgi:hypothetical protein
MAATFFAPEPFVPMINNFDCGDSTSDYATTTSFRIFCAHYSLYETYRVFKAVTIKVDLGVKT